MEWDRAPNVRGKKLKAEKTFARLHQKEVSQLEVILSNMEQTYWARLSNYRFKEWTADLSGLELVMQAPILELPLTCFDKANEGEKVETIRCITADILYDQYGVTAPPGTSPPLTRACGYW